MKKLIKSILKKRDAEEDDPNSEYWKEEYVKACQKRRIVHLDSGSARAMGKPLTFKDRTKLVQSLGDLNTKQIIAEYEERQKEENSLS